MSYTARPEIDAVMHEEALEREEADEEAYRNYAEGAFKYALGYDGIDKPPPLIKPHSLYPTLRECLAEMLPEDAMQGPLIALLEHCARSSNPATNGHFNDVAAVYFTHFRSLMPAERPPETRDDPDYE